MAQSYWEANFNTPLTPEEQTQFTQWLHQNSKKLGRPIWRDLESYDMQGLFKHVKGAPLEVGHQTDRFKKPNHPTFSDQSIYHGAPDPIKGGTFVGGSWTPYVTDGVTGEPKAWEYRPSKEMFQKGTHTRQEMQRYFQQYEEPNGSRVIFPEGIQ